MTRRGAQPPLPGTEVEGASSRVVANDNGWSLDDFLSDAKLVAPKPATDTRREANVALGREARAAGVAGERWVDVHHARAVHEHRIASIIWHVGAPWVPHVVGGKVQFDRRRRLLGAVTGLGPPDYIGFLTDGRGLVAEAKHRGGRLYRDRERPDGTENRDALERHQLRDLRAVARTPSLVLVLATFIRQRKGSPIELRVVAPFHELDQRWTSPRGGEPSVGPDELEDFRLPDDCDCYLTRYA